MRHDNLSKHQSVLVVDDDPLISRMLTLIFREEGLNTRYAENGQEACEQIALDCPDLVVLDLEMPAMNGHQVLRALKSSRQSHDVPVLILSSLIESREIAEILREGAVDYMIKPVSPYRVVDKVKNILNRKSVNAANNDDCRVMQLLEQEYHYGGY